MTAAHHLLGRTLETIVAASVLGASIGMLLPPSWLEHMVDKHMRHTRRSGRH